MVGKITWSPKAVVTYAAVIEYLLEEWTEKEIRNFVSRVDKKLQLLKTQPLIGRASGKKPHYYRTLVHKRVTLVYHYKPVKKEIELVIFWNHWRDPKQLRY